MCIPSVVADCVSGICFLLSGRSSSIKAQIWFWNIDNYFMTDNKNLLRQDKNTEGGKVENVVIFVTK